MLPREDLLKRVEHRDEIARVIDLAEQALKNWEPTFTNFLAPPIVAEAEGLFKGLTEVEIKVWGGYGQAERQMIGLTRQEIPLTEAGFNLVALDIAGNFLFDTATHRDFLGSILGTGIVREKVGDILVLGERGAQAIVVKEIAEFLTTALVQVRSVPVKVKPIPLEELKIKPPTMKAMTTVEASMRIDAVASAGLGMSRSKMVDAIAGGDVKLNWKGVNQSSTLVKSGDLITVRGKGRLEIGEVTITKKQRYRIELVRYK